jgi:hypothetical protein
MIRPEGFVDTTPNLASWGIFSQQLAIFFPTKWSKKQIKTARKKDRSDHRSFWGYLFGEE